MNYGLLVMWIFPIFSGVIGFLIGKKNKEIRNDWIDISMFVQVVILVCMGYELCKGWTNMNFSISTGYFGFGIFQQMDVIRLIFCSVVTIVFGVITQFMKESIWMEKSSNRFYLLYMTVFGLTLGAVLSTNILGILIFGATAFTLMYPLLIHRPGERPVKNAKIYFVFLVISIAMILVGFILLLKQFSAIQMMHSSGNASGIGSGLGTLGGILLFAGFAIWSGLFPLQFQITRGSSYGMIEASTILNLAVSKIGILGLFMEGVSLFPGSSAFGRMILFVGIATCVWGLIITLTSTDIRKILMGLDVAINGIIALSTGIMIIGGKDSAYAVRSCFYFFVISSVALLVLYMAALEMVRKIHTYEIKGLIASGKGHKLLMVACFLAGASLIGVPGTAGFLAQSMLVKSILTILGWKWVAVIYFIQWAFLLTAVVRIFMKLFVSEKDETIHIMTEQQSSEGEMTQEEQEKGNPYRFGEILLLNLGLVQIIIGVAPSLTVDRIAKPLNTYFPGTGVVDTLSYYTVDVLVMFICVVILGTVLYLNLVHGILLRKIRNKKNQKLKEENENSKLE